MPPAAWIVIGIITALWLWLLISVIRAERIASKKRWAQYHALRAAFDTLPHPKDKIR